MGFKDLEVDKQERLLPVVSNDFRAMFTADLKLGGPLLYEQPLVADRVVQAPKFSLTKQVLRLVCPSPNSSIFRFASSKENACSSTRLRNATEEARATGNRGTLVKLAILILITVPYLYIQRDQHFEKRSEPQCAHSHELGIDLCTSKKPKF